MNAITAVADFTQFNCEDISQKLKWFLIWCYCNFMYDFIPNDFYTYCIGYFNVFI